MIRKRKLPNGLLLVTERMPDVRSVCVGVWLRRGSRHEPPRLNGACHFIEHLVFKGTETRSAQEIALAFDSIGGQIDAFTTKEYTCFYAKVLDEHAGDAIDLLADIVQHPRFDRVELERERQVVLEEIRMVEDSPEDLLYDAFHKEFYPKHQLGRPIQGTDATVSGMSRAQLLNFFRKSYGPQNMILAAAGNLDHAKVARKVQRAFAGLASSNGRRVKMRPPRFRTGRVAMRKRELEQVHLLLGLPAHGRTTRERFTFHVLNTLLGGSMSSRLFQRVREERGLAYSVYSTLNTYSDCGALLIYAATSPNQLREVVRLTVGELRDLQQSGPSDEELEVAKQHLKGSVMLSLESTSSRMSNLARQEIYYGREHTLEETLAGIDAVSVRRVRSLARRLFTDQTLSIATVGRPSARAVPVDLLTV